MSADPIVYCLERLTDYREFERLCSDLMAGSGYRDIDPIGGSADSGRDAIFRSQSAGLTIFAYTVRADWRKKLEHDCTRIRDANHRPQRVVYVCTSVLNAAEKDSARAFVREVYGWDLELYDLERIRVLLAGELRHLVAQHPSIFCPPFFPQRGGISIASSADTLIVDHVSADHPLATWLARRLTLAGYQTWCYGTAPLAGESADESVRVLVEKRGIQYLPVISPAGVADRDFMERCALASVREEFVVPCWASAVTSDRLPTRLGRISPADFSQSWAVGARHVLHRLSSRGITPRHEKERARNIALREYVTQPVTLPKPERVFANVFPLRLPAAMLVCDLREPLSVEAENKLRGVWAFVRVHALRLVAFEAPPKSVPIIRTGRMPEFAWELYEEHEGKRTRDIAKQLVRLSLDVAAARAGLAWCEHRELFYFPCKADGEWNQQIEHVDGRQTRVALTGERTQGWGERASKFLYQLAPIFRAGRDESGSWWVTARVYVRTTNLEGKVFEGKEIGRRRKTVGKSWWNKEWLARMLGVTQALRTHGSEIRIGDESRAVIVDTRPLEWLCPVSLDVVALSRVADLGAEIAAMREVDDEEETTEGVTQTESQVDE